MTSSGSLIEGINNYILANLSGNLSIDCIAERAGVSKFHLHRIFFAHTGFDIGEYIVRRKMEKAIVLLASGVAGIDVALLLGYESHSTFSRAFKQVYGTTPSNANMQQLHNAIILRVKKGKEAASLINFDIEQRKEITIHGYYSSLPDMSRLPQIANQTFQTLLEDSDKQQQLSPVGVSISNPWFESGDDNSFFFGFTSPFVSRSRAESTLIWPAQSYATVIYTGAYNMMWQFISRCHAEIVRRKQVTLSDRTIYQCYLNSPEDTLPKDLKTQLFFPLKN